MREHVLLQVFLFLLLGQNLESKNIKDVVSVTSGAVAVGTLASSLPLSTTVVMGAFHGGKKA